jgi:hypothetical protein
MHDCFHVKNDEPKDVYIELPGWPFDWRKSLASEIDRDSSGDFLMKETLDSVVLPACEVHRVSEHKTLSAFHRESPIRTIFWICFSDFRSESWK